MSLELAHYLAKKGVNILFISYRPYYEQPLIINDYPGFIHVYSWPTNRRPTNLKSLFWYVRIFRKYNPRVLLGHFVGSNISVIVSKILSFGRTTTIVYYHTLSNAIKLDAGGYDMSARFQIIRKKILYNLFCDTIICPSTLAKDDFMKVYGSRRRSEQYKIILNPLIDRYKRHNDELRNDKIIISYLGRLEPTKGIDELITTFINYKSYRKTKIVLHIAGSGFLEEAVKGIVLKHREIIFEGHKEYSEVDDYIRRSDYIILPSLSDNLPTVGLESLMNGVPLLLSNKTGLADYITDGVEGYLFYPSEEGITDVFEKVEANIFQRENLSINARNTYLERFTMHAYCDRMFELLQLKKN